MHTWGGAQDLVLMSHRVAHARGTFRDRHCYTAATWTFWDQAGRCNMPSSVHVEPAVRAEAIAAAENRDDGAFRRSGGGAAARASFTIMYLATVAIVRPIFVDR